MSMLIMYSGNPQFQQEIIHTKKAQALVITLLVLAIISIVVIGILVIANRDVSQVINNEKYERLYSESENKVRETIEVNGISTIPGSCGTPDTFPTYIQYNCGSSNVASGELTATIDLTLRDTKTINDLSLSKDRTFDIALNGYTGEVQFIWNKPVAMEFNIIYTDSGGTVRNIRDVYDLAGVYDSLIGDNPNNDVNNIHDINFEVLDSSAASTTTKFTISATNGISLGSTISLRVTPRTKTPSDVVSLTVTPTSPTSFPFQIREFVASSIDEQDSGSPLASVISKVPLNPQVDDIFDYGILIRNNLVQ